MAYATRSLQCNCIRLCHASQLHGEALKVRIFSQAPMYNVTPVAHERYGRIIQINRDELGVYADPFQALRQVKVLRKKLVEEGYLKVRVLVDSQIMIVKDAEGWATREYKSLPKCDECPVILKETVFTHKYCGKKLFCSQLCADRNFDYLVSQWDEEEECDL